MLPIHFDSPEALAPYISFYGILEAEEGFKESYVAPPIGLCGFVLTLQGESNASINGELFVRYPYSVTGQITAPVVGDIIGVSKTLLVFIQPCGLYQLFGIDMSVLTNTSMPLSELVGSEKAEALIDDLNAASENDQMIAIMNEFFLAQRPIFEIVPKLKLAIDYIHQQKGNVTIKDIERNCFITPRSLERYFKNHVGLSPKDYIKIYRFKCLMNFIRENPGLSWEKMCEQNGYYDQSHLTRYFTRYLNIKPQALVTLDQELINYLLQE